MGNLTFKDDGRFFAFHPSNDKFFESFIDFINFLKNKVFKKSIELVNSGNTKEIKFTKARFLVLLQKDNLFFKNFFNTTFKVDGEEVIITPEPEVLENHNPFLTTGKNVSNLEKMYEYYNVDPTNLMIYQNGEFQFNDLKQIKPSILFSINERITWDDFKNIIMHSIECDVDINFGEIILEQCQIIKGSEIIVHSDDIVSATELERKYLYGVEVYLLDSALNPYQLMQIKEMGKKYNFRIGSLPV